MTTAPNEPDFWPDTSTRDGDTATADQMARAYNAWNGHLSASGLAACLERAGATEGTGPWRFHSLADAMLQRARKAGFITWNGRTWEKNA